MRLVVLAAAFALTGCGVVYTSPSVYGPGDAAGFNAATDYDVAVVPLTLETAMEANLAPYVPPRLPDAFRPAPTRSPAPLSAGDTRMPDIPSPEIAEVAAASAAGPLPEPATEAERAADTVTALPPPAEPRPYRIGVSDVLLLSANTAGATLEDVPSLLNAQAARQGYIVQDDGAIAVPDVGRVRVAGLTLEEAEGEIFEALVAQRLDPSFSLEIAEFNSQRVSIGGAVRQPSVQPISLRPLFLTEALQIAGGLATEDADYAVVRLFRDGEVYQAPLRELYADEGLDDVLLRDGDAVFVDANYDLSQARAFFEERLRLREAELREREFAFRERQAEIEEVRFGVTLAQFELQKAQLRQQLNDMRIAVAQYEIARNNDARAAAADQRSVFRERVELGAVTRDYVYVAGEVRRPNRLPLPFETRVNLADVLFDNEGVNINFADYSEIYVLRRAPGAEMLGGITAYHLNAGNAVNIANATHLELRPNDVVFVAEQPITAWGRVVTQMVPGLFNSAAAAANIAGG
ncbi:MAG: polysaccharide biosynthesis/export family protein [Paracoccaceae bacterium]